MSEDLNKFLNNKQWAVVGVSRNPSKFGYKVYSQLKKAGYSVYAINPGIETIEGDVCYPSLSALPIKPDVVSIVVPPKQTEQVIEDCIRLDIHKVWMQPGSENDDAILNAESHGISVVYNQCVLTQTRYR